MIYSQNTRLIFLPHFEQVFYKSFQVENLFHLFVVLVYYTLHSNEAAQKVCGRVVVL